METRVAMQQQSVELTSSSITDSQKLDSVPRRTTWSTLRLHEEGCQVFRRE